MPLHIAFNLITSLEKCKCPVCQKELKKIKEKYGLDQVNKGQAGNVQAERLNPEDIRNNVSDSPTSENK